MGSFAESKEDKGQQFDEEAMLEKTEKRMEILNGGTPAEEEVEDDTPTSDDDTGSTSDGDSTGDEVEDEPSTPEDETDEDDEGDKKADKDGDKTDKDEEAHKADEQKDKPQLSDAYYRAAIHSGMSEDDVVEFMASNPDLAIKTFGKMHEATNRASQEFAAIGKFKKQQVEKVKTDDNKTDANKSEFKKIDLAKLKDENPDDNLINVLEQMQEQNESLHKQLKDQPVAHTSDHNLAEEQNNKHASEQIDSFFGSAEISKFGVTYGKVAKDAAGNYDWTALMPAEQMNRVAVIEGAEQLIEGAIALGREMTVSEALERSHLMVTEPIRESIIREDIMAKVVKRSKGITLKPSNAASSTTSKKGPKTDEDIIARAEERMAKVLR